MSRLICIMPVRNEAWIIGLTARAILRWCDEIVCLLHRSRDRSLHILGQVASEHPGRVHWIIEESEQWEEMRHRQALLDSARARGATHVAMIDADEIVTGNMLPSIRSIVEQTPGGATLQIPWIQLCHSMTRFISDGQWASQDCSMAFPDDTRACWAQRDGYDYHHRHPMGRPDHFHRPLGPAFIGRWREPDGGGLMHMQMVSERRLRAKQALYVMSEVLRWPGRKTPKALNEMYGPSVHGALAAPKQAVPKQWWEPYADLMRYVDYADEPWQQREVERLWRTHGPEPFAGLDVFGVLDHVE